MSVSCSDCFSDLLCGEDTGVFSGDDRPECSYEFDYSADLDESIAEFIEQERKFVPGIDYVERFQSQVLDASAREESVAWILKGRNADSLSQYFGEDPVRCPFEQVTQILAVFSKMFKKARDDNKQQADAEKKRLEKEALKEQSSANKTLRKGGVDSQKDLKT